MNTHTYPTERIALPRRLVPRRQASVVADTVRALRNTKAPSTKSFPITLAAGDLVFFEDATGVQRNVLILDIRPNGHVDAAVYDGLPHYLELSANELTGLSITAVEHMSAEDVVMYRRWVGLDPEDDAVEMEVAA